jgi:peptidoglycan hydrolase CwlO-like protein
MMMLVQVLLLVALLALFVVAWQLVTLRRAFNALNIQYQTLQDKYSKLEQQDQARARELEQKRDDFQKNKLEIAEKRKKAHELQEEMKKLRTDLRTAQQDLIEEQKKKTVFVEVEKRVEVKVPVPAPVLAPLIETEAATDLERRYTSDMEKYKLDAENAKKALRAEHETHDKLEQELQRLRHKVEGARRIELISKNKIELLEDKLKGLGRQYYDAVSELAAVKGEVNFPPSLKAQN